MGADRFEPTHKGVSNCILLWVNSTELYNHFSLLIANLFPEPRNQRKHLPKPVEKGIGPESPFASRLSKQVCPVLFRQERALQAPQPSELVH